MDKQSKNILSFQVPQRFRDWYQRAADTAGVSLSALMRAALFHYFQTHKDIQNQDTIMKIVKDVDIVQLAIKMVKTNREDESDEITEEALKLMEMLAK